MKPARCIVIMLALAANNAHADLGRLFFTPEKREALDHARRHQLTETQVEKPAAITVNGMIHGPEGATLWVNGQPVKNQSVTAGIKVRAGEDHGVAAITPLGKGTVERRQIKVGETLLTPAKK